MVFNCLWSFSCTLFRRQLFMFRGPLFALSPWCAVTRVFSAAVFVGDTYFEAYICGARKYTNGTTGRAPIFWAIMVVKNFCHTSSPNIAQLLPLISTGPAHRLSSIITLSAWLWGFCSAVGLKMGDIDTYVPGTKGWESTALAGNTLYFCTLDMKMKRGLIMFPSRGKPSRGSFETLRWTIEIIMPIWSSRQSPKVNFTSARSAGLYLAHQYTVSGIECTVQHLAWGISTLLEICKVYAVWRRRFSRARKRRRTGEGEQTKLFVWLEAFNLKMRKWVSKGPTERRINSNVLHHRQAKCMRILVPRSINRQPLGRGLHVCMYFEVWMYACMSTYYMDRRFILWPDLML